MDTTDSNITFDAPWLVRLLQQLSPEHPAQLASRRGRRAPVGEGSRGDQTGRQGAGPRLRHRPQWRRGQLLRDLPRQGEARPASAALPRRCRLELAAGGQQHREAGGRARARPAHRGRGLARDAGSAARVLQGPGPAPRHAAGSRVLRRAVQLRGEARRQVHPDRAPTTRPSAFANRSSGTTTRPICASSRTFTADSGRFPSRPSRWPTSSPTSCTTAT